MDNADSKTHFYYSKFLCNILFLLEFDILYRVLGKYFISLLFLFQMS